MCAALFVLCFVVLYTVLCMDVRVQCKWIRTKILLRTRQKSALPHNAKLAWVRNERMSDIAFHMMCVDVISMSSSIASHHKAYVHKYKHKQKHTRHAYIRMPFMSRWVHSLLCKWIILCSTIYLRCKHLKHLSTRMCDFFWSCIFQKYWWWLFLRFIWILHSNPIQFLLNQINSNQFPCRFYWKIALSILSKQSRMDAFNDVSNIIELISMCVCQTGVTYGCLIQIPS